MTHSSVGISSPPPNAAAYIGHMMFFTPIGYMAAFGEAVRTANAAAFTIAARSAILAEAAMFPFRALDPEIPRMVAEKIVATIEGTVGAQRQMAHLTASAMRGDNWAKLMREANSVGQAGLRPARRRVRANARRLARKS